jgi:hypothetical protein
MKITTDAKNPPPNHGVDHWCRSKDPWHRDAFPSELQPQIPHTGKRAHGWMAEDWCGNPMLFVPDGTVYVDGLHVPAETAKAAT